VIEIIGLLIVAAVGMYVAWPLRLRSENPSGLLGYDTLAGLHSRRETLYREIADLDFDLRLGKVAEDDYRLEREGYVAEAAAVLEQLDRTEPAAVPEREGMTARSRELEEEVRRISAEG